MKIKELFEDGYIHYPVWLKEILVNCLPYLTQIDFDLAKYPLYRGIRTNDNFKTILPCWEGYEFSYRLETTKENRKPVDTPQSLHCYVDDAFLKFFGKRYRSDHIVFGINNLVYISRYIGYPSILLPCGDFSFCWSPNVLDFSMECMEWFEDLDEEYPEYTYDKKVKIMSDLITRELKYQTTDLKAAIESKHEIMISCDKFYVIQASAIDIDVALRVLKRDLINLHRNPKHDVYNYNASNYNANHI